MKLLNSGGVKRLVISMAALGALGGCAVVPYDSVYYNQPGYVGSAVYVAPPPVYVAPMVNFGFGYHSGGGYRGHHYGGHRHGGRGGRW
jgi:hypothetical protein